MYIFLMNLSPKMVIRSNPGNWLIIEFLLPLQSQTLWESWGENWLLLGKSGGLIVVIIINVWMLLIGFAVHCIYLRALVTGNCFMYLPINHNNPHWQEECMIHMSVALLLWFQLLFICNLSYYYEYPSSDHLTFCNKKVSKRWHYPEERSFNCYTKIYRIIQRLE